MEDYRTNPNFSMEDLVKFLVVQPSSSTLKTSKSRTLLLKTFSKDHENGQIRCSNSSTYIFSEPIHESDHHNFIQVLGSCDGLVCIYDHRYIYVINPETQEHRTLSPVSLQFRTNQLGNVTELPFTVGFGKDIITGAYKVFLMFLFDFDTTNHHIRLKTEILTLKNGKQRDTGFFPVHKNHLCDEQTSVFANGSLFWLTLPSWRWQAPSKIVAMDLHTENFRQVSLPDWYTDYSRGMRMWSFNDRLCLSNVFQSPNLDVWTLHQEHPSVKWEKIFSFNVLHISHQNAKLWMIGLAAAYFRRTGDIKPTRDQASLDRLRTISYSPTLISPYQE